MEVNGLFHRQNMDSSSQMAISYAAAIILFYKRLEISGDKGIKIKRHAQLRSYIFTAR